MQVELSDFFSGKKAELQTLCDIKVNGNELTVEVYCKGSKFYCPFTENNQRLWEGDVVELFFGFEKEPKSYYEIEISPNKLIFFAKINYFTNKRVDYVNLQNFPYYSVKTEGENYCVTIKVNMSEYEEYISFKNVYFNVFRIDGKNTDNPQRYALFPTYGNSFHDPSKMFNLSKFIKKEV